MQGDFCHQKDLGLVSVASQAFKKISIICRRRLARLYYYFNLDVIQLLVESLWAELTWSSGFLILSVSQFFFYSILLQYLFFWSHFIQTEVWPSTRSVKHLDYFSFFHRCGRVAAVFEIIVLFHKTFRRSLSLHFHLSPLQVKLISVTVHSHKTVSGSSPVYSAPPVAWLLIMVIKPTCVIPVAYLHVANPKCISLTSHVMWSEFSLHWTGFNESFEPTISKEVTELLLFTYCQKNLLCQKWLFILPHLTTTSLSLTCYSILLQEKDKTCNFSISSMIPRPPVKLSIRKPLQHK